MTTILCVADDPAIALLFEETIAGMGHRVVRTACVHEALGAVHEQAPDLVIADYGLPDLAGPQLLRILRGQGRDVPFVMLVDRDSIESVVESIECGADDCIPTPARVAQIEMVVKNALERAALRRQNELLVSEIASLRAVATLVPSPAAIAPAPVPDPEAVVLPNLDIVEAERTLISTALERAGGNKTRAAVLLNMSLRTLRHKLNAAQVLANAS